MDDIRKSEPISSPPLKAIDKTDTSNHKFVSLDNDIRKDTNFSPNIQKLRELVVSKRIIDDAESKVEVEIVTFYDDSDFVSEDNITEIEMYGAINGRPAFPKQGIDGMIGKQKVGKTTGCYGISLALINGEPFAGFTPSCTANKILMVDTEQTPSFISKKLRTFRKQLKRPKEFQVLSVRHIPISERLDKVEQKCQQHNPEIVFIDGIVDMVNNFNDPEECKNFFERLSHLANDRLIVCLLHENKGQDNSPRGHLGTILTQKAEETYRVKKDNGVFQIHTIESRHADTTDAKPMIFAINSETGFLIDEGTIIKEATEKERQGFYQNFKRIFGDDTELRRKEIITRLNERDGLEKTAAGNKITKAVSLNVLKKTDPDNSHSPYVLIDPDGSLPF